MYTMPTVAQSSGERSRSIVPVELSRTMESRAKSMESHTPQAQVYFDKAVFSSANFNSDVLLTTVRVAGTLPGLKDELLGFLTTLKRDLIELINKDYADFVNLSANLVGMDKSIESIRETLTGVRNDISSVRKEVEFAMSNLGGKLTEKALIREKKALLQTFLNIIGSVHKIEGLLNLDISSSTLKMEEGPTGNIHKPISRHESLPIRAVADDSDDTTQRVERVAGEFNQLQFYVSQCRRVPIVQALSPRIERITSTLLAGLEASFRSALAEDNLDLMISVLKPYAIVDKAEQAESLFRVVSVDDFVRKTVTSANLQNNGLDCIYNAVIRYTEKDCKTLLEAATLAGANNFNFLTNSVWPSLVETMTEITPEVFAAGIPDQFFKNYSSTKNFIKRFEDKCGTAQSISLLRHSLSYSDFMKSWSLPIYYQLRFQEIAGKLEDSLNGSLAASYSDIIQEANLLLQKPTIDESHNQPLLKPTISLCSAVALTWNNSVYLHALAHRFWKLQFQLLSRYTMWLTDTVADITSTHKSSPSDNTKNTSDLTVRGTGGVDGSEEPAQMLTKAQIMLLLLRDVDCLSQMATTEWGPLISSRLSESVSQLPDGFVRAGLADSIERLREKTSALLEGIKMILTDMIVQRLNPVWRITATYRMTNKPMPIHPSVYSAAICAPLHELLLDDWLISSDVTQSIGAQVFNDVAKSYSDIISEVLTTVNKTEASLLRLKKRGRKNAETQSDIVTDESKIRRQLYIDALDYKSQISSFGISIDDVPNLASLMSCVKEGAPPEEPPVNFSHEMKRNNE